MQKNLDQALTGDSVQRKSNCHIYYPLYARIFIKITIYGTMSPHFPKNRILRIDKAKKPVIMVTVTYLTEKTGSGNGKRMPTIREVAKLAKVSAITVSRVINKTGYISERTKKRVEAAIRQLGYVPNTLARSLRSRRTCTLALVLTDITNPFWTTVARGAEDAASKAGFSMMLGNTDESEDKQGRYITALLEKQIDGILFVPVGNTPAVIRMLKRQDVPVVVLDRRITGAKADVVRCDSEGGAYKLTNLLLSLGHRRIAVLSGPRTISTAEDRVRGYQRALAEQGIPSQAELMQYGNFTVESGAEMVKNVLKLSPRPTAVFAGNN
ncbi:MAG: hypothetical protein A3K46_08020, partial [Chloroflexi bacterium RBG_13_60_9]